MRDSYTKGYRDGFMNAAQMKENFKYTIFGYDLVEVLEIMGKYYDDQRKSQIIVIDHIDKAPVIIKRNGKIVYSEE